jgi:hypothetical protein
MANPPVTAQSADPNIAGVLAENSGVGGIAVLARATSPAGIPTTGMGVHASGAIGIRAEGFAGFGVSVFSQNEHDGVRADCNGSGAGVHGNSDTGAGVQGESNSNAGVLGTGHGGPGVKGQIGAATAAETMGFLGGRDPQFEQRAGVYGQSDQQGVMGLTTVPKGTGVYGGGTSGANGDQIGVRGETQSGVGVQGQSFGDGVAIQGRSFSRDKGLAGQFIGNVHVQGNPGTSSGDLRVEGTASFGGPASFDGAASFGRNVAIAGNLNISSTGDIVLGDIAEGFSTQDGEIIEPGTVVVLNQHGLVRPGDEAYDKKVAGVVSGAGNYRPAIVLDKQSSQATQLPVALIGKVCCKVDAQYSPIEVGDLLTTSPTPGHAMKARDSLKAFGAVIGKALCPLNAGQGMIPILIVLQ